MNAPVSLRDVLWDDQYEVQAGELWGENLRTIAELKTYNEENPDDQFPFLVYFRPPEMSPFTNSRDDNHRLSWQNLNELYLKITDFDQVNEIMRVDFGPYFDFPITTQLQLEINEANRGEYVDNHFLPNYPDDTA